MLFVNLNKKSYGINFKGNENFSWIKIDDIEKLSKSSSSSKQIIISGREDMARFIGRIVLLKDECKRQLGDNINESES